MYETIMKQHIKQKVKHKMKPYSTRVSVRQMKEQHSKTKSLMKQRKKEVCNREVVVWGTPRVLLNTRCCKGTQDELIRWKKTDGLEHPPYRRNK